MEEDAFIKNDTNKYESEKRVYTPTAVAFLQIRLLMGKERGCLKMFLVFNDGGRVSE